MQTAPTMIAPVSNVANVATPPVTRATLGDVDVLADLHERCMQRAFNGVCNEFSRMVSAPAVARNVARQAIINGDAFIVRLGNRAVGYAIARCDDAGIHNLEAIGVLENERRHGLGRLLFHCLRSEIVKEGGTLRARTPVAHEFFASVVGRECVAARSDVINFMGHGYIGRGCETREYRAGPQPYGLRGA